MTRSITIRWASSHYVLGRDDGVRVRFDVVCSTNVTPKIFAYRMEPIENGKAAGFFSHICSPVDIEEYPADYPTEGKSPEWFRLSFVDVYLRSVTEAEDFIEIVISDVRRILQTLNTMDTIFTGGTEIVGAACEPQGSSDSSNSTSGSQSSASLGALNSLSVVGTSEQFLGVGVVWSSIGTGDPIGSSESLAANTHRCELQAGESSKLLLVQGFDFSGLSDDCVIEGIESRVTLRDAANDPADSSSLSSSSDSGSSECPHLVFLTLQHPAYGMGSNRATGNCISGPAWEILTTGDDGDRWGFPKLKGKDLKDGAFGLGFIVKGRETAPAIVDVGHVELEVFFKEEY